MKRIISIGALLLFTVFITSSLYSTPTAICVPWYSADPNSRHYTYSGASITLKGIARGDATEYRWTFGDENSISWTPITDPYNLGVTHTYTGVISQLFIATLYVRNAANEVDQDDYFIQIYESTDLSDSDHLDVRINMAIDEGLWWLHTNMVRGNYAAGSPGYGQPYGHWDPSYYPLAATGAAVDAFQLHGSKANMDYDSDPYVETVQRALNYLLVNSYSYPIGMQAAGDPDTNENGIGIVANYSSSITNNRQTYIGGICMVALASSGAPNRIAQVGRTNIVGRTYGEIVQDMVDFFAWGQIESNSWPRGGWRYYANYSEPDMSTTQWPALGMLAAEENMGSVIPAFVKSELGIYLDTAQNTALNNDNGAFAYHYPGGATYYNLTKAAAGLICHEFIDTPLDDPKVQMALGFIYRHWNDSGTGWDDTQLHGNSYGMYGIMKAFRIPEPDLMEVTEYNYNAGSQTENSFNWYYTPAGQSQAGLASYTVSTQQPDGSWDDTVGPNAVNNAFCTGWRVLVLLKGVTIQPPVAVICDADEQEYNLNQDINLDGSCSYHPNILRSIVSYEWDFDYDGTFTADASGVQTTLEGGYPSTGFYPVALRVIDDNPEYLGGPQSGIIICNINVHPPPHAPHAFAGGPYIGWVNVPLTLDGSASWDPDNEIVLYEWDLDNDGLFGMDDDDCFGEPSDATGVNPQWQWAEPYYGPIALKVTDAAGEFPASSDIDYTTVEIGNHSPTADPGGPYTASPDLCIEVDGSNSSDPDPGDSISYAWDLDGDGEYDDSTAASTPFCVGDEIGLVYNICLKVTDSFGKYDIQCTTIEIVPNQPPTAKISSEQIIEQEYYQGTDVFLAGSDSSDPDSTPGTNDDIVSFEWYEGTTLLGEGTDILVPLNLGEHTITLIVIDNGGLSDSDESVIIIRDTTAPVLTVPDDIIVEQASAAGTQVDLTASAEDICDVDLELYDDAPAIYPLGTTVVTFTVIDDSGNSTSDTTAVTVEDTTVPILSVSSSQDELWPPNHEYVTINLVTIANDICDADVQSNIELVSVTSDELEDDKIEKGGKGDGNTLDDIIIVDSHTIQLRAERMGGDDGRVYTVNYIVVDASGNSSEASAIITVPHNVDDPVIDSGVQYIVYP